MASQQLSRKYAFIGDKGFDGGISSENAIAVSQNKMVIADNILIGTAPTRRKRGGMEKYHTGTFDQTASYPASGEPIRGIIEFWRTASLAGNPISDLFLHQTSKVWSIDDRNTVGVDRTGALSLATTGIPSYQPFNQKLYFCSTVNDDGYNKWTGTGDASAATDPDDGPGKYLCSHLGRMIMAGNNDFPFRVYFSSALDPEDWSSTAPSNGTSLDLDDNGDPQGITGIVSFQGRLYVFTRRGTFEITGTTAATFVVTPISSGIGCIGHASIAVVPNDIIFASDRGVHSLRQVSSGRQTESTFLSRDIQKLWTELVNASRFGQFMAAYDETINSYVITVVSGSDTGNVDCLVYNIEFGTWTQWKDIEARSISIAFIGNKKQLIIGREDGTIAYLGRPTRQDFGESFSARFKTGTLYPGGDFAIEKKFMNLTVLASATAPATITVSWDIDGQVGGTDQYTLEAGDDLLGTTLVLGQSILGIGQYLPYTTGIDQVGVGIQLDFTIQSAGDVEFYGFILEVDDANPTYGTKSI
jgi:hypothetical protein